METRLSARIQSLGVVLLLVLKGYTATEKYRVEKTLTTWNVANKSCSLFTPTFTRYNEGIVLQGADASMKNNKTWTGYIKTYHDFAYIGCINVDHIDATFSKKFTYSANPGLCFAECGGHEFFGIGYDGFSKWSCYCFRNRPDTRYDREPHCTKECDEATHVACGRKRWAVLETQYFVSVYQDVGISTGETDLCRSYDPQTPSFQWEKCTQQLYTMCRDSTASSTVNVSDSDGYQWHEAVKKCLDDEQYPLYNAIDHPTLPSRAKPTEHLWTAVFRSLTIHKVSDSSSTVGSLIEYGYLENSTWDSGFLLKFTSNSADTGISLCSIAPPPISSTTSTTTTSVDRNTTPGNIESTTSVSFDSGSTALTASGPTSTPASDITTGPTELDNTPDKLASADVGLYIGMGVGVGVGGLALIMLLVAAVCFYRRKRKRPARASTAMKATTDDIHISPCGEQVVKPEQPAIDNPKSVYYSTIPTYETIPCDAARQRETEHEYGHIHLHTEPSNDYLAPIKEGNNGRQTETQRPLPAVNPTEPEYGNTNLRTEPPNDYLAPINIKLSGH